MNSKEFDLVFKAKHQDLWESNFDREAKNNISTLILKQASIILDNRYKNLSIQDREDVRQQSAFRLLEQAITYSPGWIEEPNAFLANTIRFEVLNYLREKRKQPISYDGIGNDARGSLRFADQIVDHRTTAPDHNVYEVDANTDKLLSTLIADIDDSHPNMNYGEILAKIVSLPRTG